MEVTSLNFEIIFPRIINAYLRCAFVAIDCEFSGVRAFDTHELPTRTPLGGGSSLAPLDPGMDLDEQEGEADQASLVKEEAYRRLRSAARKYTVLQVGMTFSWVDKHRSDLFKTETYSFLVSPFVDWSTSEGVKICRVIERDITVNSASIQFLQSSSFNFRALLSEGLRYLTYAEEKKAAEYAKGAPRKAARDVKPGTEQVGGDPEDERIRSVIAGWLEHEGSQVGESLQVIPPEGKAMTRSWTSKVYSIVRENFENCCSWKDSGEDCVVIKHVDVATEAKRQTEKRRAMDASIRKAIGLRNVLDIILGNDLTDQVIPSEFADAHMRATELKDWDPKPEAEKKREREDAIKTLTDKLSLLKTRHTRPILVGHNLGWDIAFLTEAFLRPLPDSLEEFVHTVDTMFPRLLDTRALSANHAAGFKDLSLTAIHSALLTEGQEPRCYWEPGMGYRDGSAYDAGYDSLITAEAFLKMGRKLVVQKRGGKNVARADQGSINREIVDWDSSVWDPFRGKFSVYGQRARG